MTISSYNNIDNFSPYLEFKSFYDLINTLKNNSAPYLSYYKKNSLFTKLTFSQYAHKVISCAQKLKNSYNLSIEEKVIVSYSNSHETLIIKGALLYLGATIIPVNPLENSDTLNYLIKKYNPKLIIHENCETEIFTIPLTNFSKIESLSETEPSIKLNNCTTLNSIAAIFSTSGTTGTSKGSVLTIGNLFINTVMTIKEHSIESSNVHMCVLPLFHVNAFSFSFITTLYSQSRLVLSETFFQPAFWSIINSEKVSIVSIVPSIVYLLTKDPRKIKHENYPSLKYFVSAAAPLSTEMLNEFYHRYQFRINQAYGLSETVNFSLTVPAILSKNEYETIMFSESLPSAGRELWGNHVEIMNLTTNKICEENELGEIVIAGWNVMQGYYQDKEATLKAFEANWFHTGDLAYAKTVNGSKYFYITGRIKEIAKRNGELIPLRGLDDELRKKIPSENFCCVGFDNQHTGEEVGLFIEENPDFIYSDEDILTTLKSIFPFFKRPKVIVRGQQIPRTPTGKIKRNDLKKEFSSFKTHYFNNQSDSK